MVSRSERDPEPIESNHVALLEGLYLEDLCRPSTYT